MPISKMDEELQAEMLELYCEAITADPSVQAPAGLQPELAGTVRRMASDLTSLEADATFTEELHQRLLAQAQTLARSQMGKAPIRSRLVVAFGRCTRRVRPLPALGGLAVAAALLLFVALQLRGEDGVTPSLIAGATQAPMMPTSGPAATVAAGSMTLPVTPTPAGAPTRAPSEGPLPNWLQTGELVASDQGVTLAYLRAIIYEPRSIVLFVAVGGPTAKDGSPYLPADLQVLDPAGREYPIQVTWLDSTDGATLGTVALTEIDTSAASLRLRVTEMRAAQGQSLHGSWQVEPIRRFQPGAPFRLDELSEVDGLQCFRTGDITIANNCYTPCSQAAQGTPAALLAPAMTAGPATLAPQSSAGPATATPPPVQETPAAAVPFPTQPAAPPPPTVAPTVTPAATAAPFMSACDFTDWGRGLFGTTLLVSGPQPHAVYVLVTLDGGQVRRVSEQEFAEARQQAY